MMMSRFDEHDGGFGEEKNFGNGGL